MTRERKAAIKQWEAIRERIKQTSVFSKPVTEYNWQCNCWFCHYMRDHSAPFFDNGCRKCPLWKWARTHNGVSFAEDDCGCSACYDTLYHKVCNESLRRDERIKACDLVIAALKGEHIWEIKE